MSPAAARLLRMLLLQGALLAMVLAGLEAGARWLVADHDDLKYRHMYDDPEDPEVIIQGTSRAVHGLVPRLLARPGLRVYNYAFNAGRPHHAEAWWQLYKALGKRPRLVIYAVDWTAFQPDVRRYIENDARFLPPRVVAGLLADGDRSATQLLTHLTALNAERRNVQHQLLYGRPAGYARYRLDRYDRGFVPIETPGGFFPSAMSAWYDQVAPSARLAFERHLRDVRATGARVVLVQLPDYFPLSGAHPTSKAMVRAVAARLDVPFLDYYGAAPNDLNADKAWFMDATHLNEAGAERVSARLAADLARLGL